MMRIRVVAAVVVTWITCAMAHTKAAEVTRTTVDPIDELVATLSASPLWLNGSSPIGDLPESASTDKVIARVFQLIGFEEGRVKTHRILETRVVLIPSGFSEPCTAVLVETDLGRKIVLLKYGGARTGWW